MHCAARSVSERQPCLGGADPSPDDQETARIQSWIPRRAPPTPPPPTPGVLTRVSALVQVVYVVAGTLIAAALVAMLGDNSGHRALMAERQALGQQMAGSWKADHMPLQSLQMKEANARLLAKQETAAVQQPVPVMAATSLDDMKAGNGDVKAEASAKLFGAAAGMGGNSYEPPYEPEEDADVGVCPKDARRRAFPPSLPPLRCVLSAQSS